MTFPLFVYQHALGMGSDQMHRLSPRNHYGSSDEHEVCGEYLLGITQMNLDLCLKEDKQGFVSVGAACHSLVLCVYRQSNA